jgi:hypothetical protein
MRKKTAPVTISRQSRLVFASAVLLTLVGSGNIVIGRSRAAECTKILIQAPTPNPFNEALPKDELVRSQAAYAHRLRDRIAFYEMVSTGGSCFLAVAAALFVIGVLQLRTTRRGMHHRVPFERA